MTQSGDKFLMLSFDTESNIGSWTQDYSSIDLALPLLLDLLARQGVKATFLWEARAALHNPAMVRRTRAAGHEIGGHSFQHETIGQVSYFIPGDRAILPEEIPNRVRRTTQVLKEITGERPVSFRAPRLWGGPQMVRILAEEGYCVDSSDSIASDADPCFPYEPTIEQHPGAPRFVEMPVAGMWGTMLEQASPVVREFSRSFCLPGSTAIGQWPILRMYGAHEFRQFLQPMIEHQLGMRGYTVLSVYLHPWEFIPMPHTLTGLEATVHLAPTLHTHCGPQALQALETFIAMTQQEGFRYLTMKEYHALHVQS